MKRWMNQVSILSLVAMTAMIAACCHGEKKSQGIQVMNVNDNNPNACSSEGPQCGLPSSEEELKKLLTPEQYEIMRNNGTERAFLNEYWDHKEAGLYVDRISGEALFSSLDKFDSGSGWPSFTKPVTKDCIQEKRDSSYGMIRTEVRSNKSDSHLGHVFDDGPAPTRLRYCINSASLRFIPVAKLEDEGYAEFLPLFGVEPKGQSEATQANAEPELATFGAGCFWGVEAAFQNVEGVLETAVGYLGGTMENPTYEDVCAGNTGHAEVVQVKFDPARVSYEQLMDIFWKIHDPTTLNRQGPDIGDQYRSAIFFHSPQQEVAAFKSKKSRQDSGNYKRKIVTEITATSPFYRAEEYHQKYLAKRGKTSCHINTNE